MPLVTHFRSPEGDLLPIAAAAQYTVEIPAAGSEDLKGWWLERDVYMRRIMLEGVTEEMAVHVSCPVGAIFTEHGLYVTQDVGVESFIDLELSSLPAAATSVHLLAQHAEGGGAVYMPVVGQGGSGSTTELEQLVQQTVEGLRDAQEDIDGIEQRVTEIENGGGGGGGTGGTTEQHLYKWIVTAQIVFDDLAFDGFIEVLTSLTYDEVKNFAEQDELKRFFDGATLLYAMGQEVGIGLKFCFAGAFHYEDHMLNLNCMQIYTDTDIVTPNFVGYRAALDVHVGMVGEPDIHQIF
jgi:hypothetical protein